MLNEEQLIAVTHKEGPLLVLAGAGSGKTRVLTYRTSWLIKEKNVDPGKIVLLTFTNKAAGEMKERIRKMGDRKIEIGFSGTFHTFCAKLLRAYGMNVGVNPGFVIFDSDDSESVMKQVLKDMEIDTKQSKPGMFLALISKMKNDLVSVKTAEETAKDFFYRQLAKVWKAYQERLTKNNSVDFDDLLVKAVDLLRIDRIRKEINEKFEWILVDEYQDTNKAQFELTKLMAGENGNITAVGDAAQAIYSFRGADYRNLKLLEDTYPNLTTVGLPKNYRSTQSILDAAYSVVSNNTNHPTIKLSATREIGGKVGLFEAVDERDEAKYVVDCAKKIIDRDEELAILYRTNAQSRSLEDELLKRDIPYKLIGGLRFYNRAEVKDLIAYLRLLYNPEEEISRIRIEKIGKRKATAFDEWLFKLPVEEREEEQPGKLLEQIINVTNYLDKFDERDEDDLARIENINELLAVAGEYTNVSLFLESAALSEADIKQHRSNAKITLMTVHAAKGLEFENVFVVGLEEGLFPHSRSMFEGGKEEIEEERRLMYVAMTRAKENLTLSFARSRLTYGGRHTSIPSRFLAEIPEEYLQKIQIRGWIPGQARNDDSGRLPRSSRNDERDEFGDKKRIIVQDWEVAEETKDDFSDIDNW